MSEDIEREEGGQSSIRLRAAASSREAGGCHPLPPNGFVPDDVLRRVSSTIMVKAAPGSGTSCRQPPPPVGRFLQIVNINDLVHLGIKTVEYVLQYLVRAGCHEGGDLRGELCDPLLKALDHALKTRRRLVRHVPCYKMNECTVDCLVQAELVL